MLKSFPKILIITSLAILFFQISSAKAEVRYEIFQKYAADGSDCTGLKQGYENASMEDCKNRNVTIPNNCLPEATIGDRCICCYFNSAPTQTRTPTPTPTPTPKKGIQFIPQVGIPNSGFENGYTFEKNDSIAPIAKYIRAIYNYAIGIIGILAAVVLMVGGVLWIVAGGNSSQISEAKAWIGAALTGLVLALTSYLMLNTINPALVNLQTTGIQNVAQAPTGECCAYPNPYSIDEKLIYVDNLNEIDCKAKGGNLSGKKCPTSCCAWNKGQNLNGLNKEPTYDKCVSQDPSILTKKICDEKSSKPEDTSFAGSGECKPFTSATGISTTYQCATAVAK